MTHVALSFVGARAPVATSLQNPFATLDAINEGTLYPYGADGYANPLLDAISAAFR